MNSFFRIFTLTPWDSLNLKTLTEVKLYSLKNIFKTFPVIEPEFFDDLLSNLYKFDHYSLIESIKRIVGPENEDYDIEPWNFIWGMDNERRIFQFLFQRVKNEIKGSQATLVALAPPELGTLFAQYKKEALHRTLSLLNNPKNMKFLLVLSPKGKSVAEKQQLLHISKKELEKFKFKEKLKQMPNIKGEWVVTRSPRCSNCGKEFPEIKALNVWSFKFKCPYCGHQNK